MKPSEMATHVNNLTDENHDFNDLIGFINDGIAEINMNLNATFPNATTDDEEFPFPEVWQRTVLVPFVAARVKQKDSSQFEYNDLYGQFQMNLLKFATKYTVPDAYKDQSVSDSVAPDFTGNPYTGW